MPTYSGSSWHYSTEECQANMPNGVAKLLTLYAQATENELKKGISWYPEARDEADEIARLYGFDRETVVRVAAAISPKCPWEVNMESAAWVVREYISGCYIPDYELYASGDAYLQNCPKPKAGKAVLSKDARVKSPPGGGLKSNVIKALWILQGHDCLSGPKVTDFYECVMHWESYLGACIDSHAIQAWFGNSEGGTYGIPPRFYTIIRADYVHAAKLVGLSPLQFQAVLWLVKKRVSKVQGRRSLSRDKKIEFVVAEEAAA